MSCYTRNTNKIFEQDGQSSCGSTTTFSTTAQQCCQVGDTCLGNAICYFTHSQNKATGFYVGGCTGEPFPGPVCSMQCTDNPTSDIIYNSTTSLWACCYGSGNLDCSVPSLDTFEAPSPQQLLADYASSLPSSSSSKSSPTLPASYSAPISFASSRPTTCPSGTACLPRTLVGLSTGAKAGIGIAAAVLGISLAILAFSILRRKGHNSNNKDKVGQERPDRAYDDGAPYAHVREVQCAEVSAEQSVKLSDSLVRVEISGAGVDIWELE